MEKAFIQSSQSIRGHYYALVDALSIVRSLTLLEVHRLTVEEIVEEVLSLLIEHQDIEHCSLFLFKEKNLEYAGGKEWDDFFDGDDTPVPLSPNGLRKICETRVELMHEAVKTKMLSHCHDCTSRLSQEKVGPEPGNHQIGSLISVPIASTDEVLGVINVFHEHPGHFQTWHENSLTLFGSVLANILENHRMFQSLNNDIEQRETELEAANVHLQQEITQRKLEQLQLQESEERHALALSVANDGIWDWHLKENTVFFDARYYTMAGYAPNEFPSRYEEWMKRIHPNDARRVELAINDYLEDKRDIFDIEFMFRRKNDTYMWIRERGKIVARDIQGNPNRFIGTHTDITQRKSAEEKIYLTEERYRTIIEGAPVGVWLLGPDRRTIQVNECLCSILGYRQDEIIGKLPMEFADENNQKIFIEQTAKIETTEKREYQINLRHKDGHYIPAYLNATTLHKKSGDELTAVAFVTDLTEQKVAETALRRAIKMDAVGQMAGGIAHDFNNILGIIMGNLDVLDRQLKSDGMASKRIDTMMRSSQRAADLTKQLLSFSRKQATEATATNVNRVIREMESLIVRSVTPEVMVEHKFAEDLWQTEIDSGDFQDVLLNLVLNARDAIPDGGRLIIETSNCTFDAAYRTENSGVEPGEYVCLSVSDTGIGISPEQQEHIFEPFYTTKPGGTGLGLAMVYGFVKRSKAYITVDSIPNVSTRFQIYLPRVHGQERRQETFTDQNEALPRGSETILLVDDESELLELTRDSLQALGYRVLTACNGQQAIQGISEDPAIALLFSDVVMPGGMNGYELAERARIMRPDLKILFTSGYAEKAVYNEAHRQFSSSLISKPSSQSEIAQYVRFVLDDKAPL